MYTYIYIYVYIHTHTYICMFIYTYNVYSSSTCPYTGTEFVIIRPANRRTARWMRSACFNIRVEPVYASSAVLRASEINQQSSTVDSDQQVSTLERLGL